MRWLMLAALAAGCTAEDSEDYTAFAVTITNTDEGCAELARDMAGVWGPDDLAMADVCNCVDTDESDCMDDIDQKSESLTYNLFQDESNIGTISIEVDGQSFASGVFSSFEGCVLEYESPVWLDTIGDAKVTWQVRSVGVLADTTGACNDDFPGSYHFLGIEEIEIMESDSTDYPVGRTVQKVIHGKRIEVEE